VAGFSLRCRAGLVFADECGTHIALTRLYSGAPKGKGLMGGCRVTAGARTHDAHSLYITLEGAMDEEAAMVIEGATDASVFEG
jgi:hypothetical protein